jgi:predicted ATP-grasp superfamily ATP-dependent carboligase
MSDEPQEPAGAASEEAEQIGLLLFVPSADYPYPFAVEKPPRFWMEEQTGALAAAIEVYMRTEDLKHEELELIKLYLRQYIERAVISSDANRKLLLQDVEKLRKVSDVERFADELSEAGIEPF